MHRLFIFRNKAHHDAVDCAVYFEEVDLRGFYDIFVQAHLNALYNNKVSGTQR